MKRLIFHSLALLLSSVTLLDGTAADEEGYLQGIRLADWQLPAALP